MPNKKVKADSIIVVEDEICKEVEKLGIEEACNQSLHFLSSFGQLNYKQCMFLVDNLPGPNYSLYTSADSTDTDQIVMLYALTDAVVINYTLPKEGNPMFSCKSNCFENLSRKIDRSWQRVLRAIASKSKVVGRAIGEDMINHIETLLKDCSKRLEGTECPYALNQALSVVKEARTLLPAESTKKISAGKLQSVPEAAVATSIVENGTREYSNLNTLSPTPSSSVSSSEPSSPSISSPSPPHYHTMFTSPSASSSSPLSSPLSSPPYGQWSSLSPYASETSSPLCRALSSSLQSSEMSSPHQSSDKSSSPLCRPLSSSPLQSSEKSSSPWGAESSATARDEENYGNTKHGNCSCVMCDPSLSTGFRKETDFSAQDKQDESASIEENCENTKHGNCSCIMCTPNQVYPVSPKKADVLRAIEQEEQNKPLLSLRVKSPSKLLSPSKYSRSNSVLANSPNWSVSSPLSQVEKYGKGAPLSPINIGDSPIKHGVWCDCEMCFTPPQEKIEHIKKTPGSTKKAANNENSSLKSNTPNKTLIDYLQPGAKRPLLEPKGTRAIQPENKKPRLLESPTLSNGKINAFSFMMNKAKAKKH